MAGGGIGGGKRRIPEVDLVPILDGMTSVIFFLVLSSTFIQFTKVTLPPSQVAPMNEKDVQQQKNEPASNPKIFAISENKEIILSLVWEGKEPGKIIRKVPVSDSQKRSEKLTEAAKEVGLEFNKKFSTEKHVQLGMSKQATYQQMIDVMDGVRQGVKDIVLLSSSEEVVVRKQIGL